MSFSSSTKNELARVIGAESCCKLAEGAALVKTCGSIQISGQQRVALHIITENAAVARKIFSLLKETFKVKVQVLARRKARLKKRNSYLVRVLSRPDVVKILKQMGIAGAGEEVATGLKEEIIKKECCKRAYLRGVFLGSGFVSNPAGAYHLEILAGEDDQANFISRIMQSFGLNAKIGRRKNWHVVYLKEGDQIAKCLNIMEAHNALLNFENVRIYKDIRNQVNRMVNCETANLNKTVNAAVRQLKNIQIIASTVGLRRLPLPLQEVAELRIKHPNASFKELGELCHPPVGKSGINHRMRKLEQVAQELRNRSRS